jgi:Tol biopolymer transport system component
LDYDTSFSIVSNLRGSLQALGDECQLQVLDVETGHDEVLLEGNYFIHGYSPITNNLILSTQPNIDVSILTLNLDNRQLSSLNQVTHLLSLPTISRDGQFIAYMGQVGEMPQLLITDVSTSTTHSTEIQKPPDLPAVITDWHPETDQFLYEDAGTIYVYDAASNTVEAAVTAQAGEEFGIPNWVCPTE